MRSALLHRIDYSPWGQAAIAATVISFLGYVVQTILDFVPNPAIVGELEFYGVFAAFAIVALVTGVISVATGWRRSPHTVRLGLIAIAYVVLVQVLQTVWD